MNLPPRSLLPDSKPIYNDRRPPLKKPLCESPMTKKALVAILLAWCGVCAALRCFTQEPPAPKSSAPRNATSLTHFAATIAEVFQIETPKQADTPIASVRDKIRELSPGPIDRVVIYNPDAVAQWLAEKYPEMFRPVVDQTQIRLPLATMMPSVTPVCFGTTYTGALPAVHGIQKYAKPIIRIDTLFDSLVRSGKRVALVAEPTCSMAKIFLERKIDYFTPPDARSGLQKALELIEQDQHDFLVVYDGDYDSTMHKTGTESEAAIKALQFQVDGFDTLVKGIQKHWTKHNTLITFSPDHGVHDQTVLGKTLGKHGTDRPDDINIIHFLGVIPRSQPSVPSQ